MEGGWRIVAMSSKLCNCGVDQFLGNFRTPSEYMTLSTLISHTASLKETAVLMPYDDVGCKGKWFTCDVCGGVWRLVEPDPPFTGLWGRVQ